MMRYRFLLIFFIPFTFLHAQEMIKNENGEIVRETQCKMKPILDTLNYLKQNFEVNKLNYIGQPFSKILNDMTLIQPKTVWSHSPHNNKNIRTFTAFKFNYMEQSFHNAIVLYIDWETPLPSSETKALSTTNQFYFTNEERLYYGSKIVKDITISQ